LIYRLLFLIAIITTAFCDTITVCNNCDVNSIQNAINVTSSGDTVKIDGGEYRETNITIDKKLHLIGVNSPIIDGDNSRSDEVIIIQADSVIVEGLHIQNVGPSFVKDLAAIRVQRKKHFQIRNNHITGTMFAIYLEYADSGLVENNRIIGNETNVLSAGNGIHAWYCNNIILKDNVVKTQRDGIYFEFVNNSEIYGNDCADNLRYGLHFMFSNDDIYNNNVFTNNGAGVAVMFSKNIDMSYNRFVDNWGGSSYGLLLKEIYDADIQYNHFQRNSIGIRVEGSSRVKYKNNDFYNNGWAIKIAGGCYDNIITENNFVSNSFNLSLDSAINSNTFNSNYWSGYNGYDLNHDGIGDVPYRPIELFNYIVTKTPEATVLLRSLFLDIINLSERVTPIFTPKNVVDDYPYMKLIKF